MQRQREKETIGKMDGRYFRTVPPKVLRFGFEKSVQTLKFGFHSTYFKSKFDF